MVHETGILRTGGGIDGQWENSLGVDVRRRICRSGSAHVASATVSIGICGLSVEVWLDERKNKQSW